MTTLLTEVPPRISLEDSLILNKEEEIEDEGEMNHHQQQIQEYRRNSQQHFSPIYIKQDAEEKSSKESSFHSGKKRSASSSSKRFLTHKNSIKSMSKYSVSGDTNFSPKKLPSIHIDHKARAKKSPSDFTPINSSLGLQFSPVPTSSTLLMKIHCSFFCGGTLCKHEDYLRTVQSEHQKKEMSSSVTSPKRIRKYYAIEGLNSHHVTNNVIASQRLSSRLIKKFDIIGQFKHYNVVSVVNLQERGEHAYCGDGILEKSGFSYDPEEDLMKHKIQYYSYAFQDMSIPDLNLMISVVKTMKLDSEKGRILVHCHAGLGRTGLVICCFLIYCKYFHNPTKAILFVRSRRPGSIQTKSQVQFVSQFYNFLTRSRTFFHSATLKLAMEKQRAICCGTEYIILRRTPKLVFEICQQLSNILFASNNLPQLLTNFFLFSPDTITRDLEAYKSKINIDDWSSLRRCNNFPTLTYLLFDWLEGFDPPILDQTLDYDPNEDLGWNLKVRGMVLEVEIVNVLVRTLSQMFRRLIDQSLAESFVLLFLYKLCKTTLGAEEDIVRSFIRQMKRGSTTKC